MTLPKKIYGMIDITFFAHLATYVNCVLTKETEIVRNHNLNFYIHLIIHEDTHVLL